jgi:hypothetical protein
MQIRNLEIGMEMKFSGVTRDGFAAQTLSLNIFNLWFCFYICGINGKH